VALHLRVGGQAAYPKMADPPLAGERRRWKRPPTTVGQRKGPVPARVELDWMHVDLAPVLVCQNEIRRGASVEPDLNGRVLERREDFDNCVGTHHV
jgi:hypothetical protein